jgi:Kef-type K+ transport system membrane component KefB
MPLVNLHVTYVMFLIFAGTAVLSTVALFTRQSLLVAYIVLGIAFGPFGLKLVANPTIIQQAGNVGIIFLLFLLGLNLQPQNLLHSLRKMSVITVSSSLLFFAIGFGITYLFHYTLVESLIIGIAAMFSSTIIGIKLLPTTMLHHQHTGELMISVLLLQDIIAIIVIFSLEVLAQSSLEVNHLWITIAGFPVLFVTAYLFEKFILSKLIARFDKIHEYIFIVSIGWCLCMAELSSFMGLSEEIGAFIAGVALASNPIAFYIAESLKPLRDFFLVLFFFSVGAMLDFNNFNAIAIPAFIVAGLILTAKPLFFRWLLVKSGEVDKVSREVGVRLGQMSEFSLLVINMALTAKLISLQASNMAQAAVIITFIVSCYWTVMNYPTPLAASDKLRRD